MAKFYVQICEQDRLNYIKDLKRNIDFNTYPKVLEFMQIEQLYITNVKTGPIRIKDNNSILVIDNSKNKWFVFAIDGKIQLIAKKNVLIHTDKFEYEKRDTSFTKKQKIKNADYLVEYVENVGANLSLNINNYNDVIGKAKWDGEYDEIGSMTLEYADKNIFTGYTFNSDSFSLCNIGKQTEKQTNILL